MQKRTFNPRRFYINKDSRTDPIKWYFSALGRVARKETQFHTNVDNNLAQMSTLRINAKDMIKI